MVARKTTGSRRGDRLNTISPLSASSTSRASCGLTHRRRNGPFRVRRCRRSLSSRGLQRASISKATPSAPRREDAGPARWLGRTAAKTRADVSSSSTALSDGMPGCQLNQLQELAPKSLLHMMSPSLPVMELKRPLVFTGVSIGGPPPPSPCSLRSAPSHQGLRPSPALGPRWGTLGMTGSRPWSCLSAECGRGRPYPSRLSAQVLQHTASIDLGRQAAKGWRQGDGHAVPRRGVCWRHLLDRSSPTPCPWPMGAGAQHCEQFTRQKRLLPRLDTCRCPVRR